ncbi:MAG: phasin family protein [bacterium]
MEDNGILKKVLLAGLGMYALTREKAQEITADLVKRGELSKDEGAKFVKDMLDRADEEATHLKQMVNKQVEQALSKIRPTYDDEFKKLHQKIDKLTKEVQKLTK